MTVQQQKSCADKEKNNSGLQRADDSSVRGNALYLKRFQQLPSGFGWCVGEQFLAGAGFFQQLGLHFCLQLGDLITPDGVEDEPGRTRRTCLEPLTPERRLDSLSCSFGWMRH
jgi:hypothetical protein